MEKFARKCSKTGEGMDEGYIVNEGEFYFKNEADVLEYLRGNDYITAEGIEANALNDEDLLEWAYNDEIYFWTDWEDDYQYKLINGELVEL